MLERKLHKQVACSFIFDTSCTHLEPRSLEAPILLDPLPSLPPFLSLSPFVLCIPHPLPSPFTHTYSDARVESRSSSLRSLRYGSKLEFANIRLLNQLEIKAFTLCRSVVGGCAHFTIYCDSLFLSFSTFFLAFSYLKSLFISTFFCFSAL
jgi:hypothetical protein